MPDPKPDYEAMARELNEFATHCYAGGGFDDRVAADQRTASALASVDSAAVARERKRLEGKLRTVRLRIDGRLEAHRLARPSERTAGAISEAMVALRWLDEALSEEP